MAARLLIAALLVLTACASETPEPRPDFCADAEGGPIETGLLQIGQLTDDGFISYETEPQVPFEFGFQGGTMITPVLALPADRVDNGDCFVVNLNNDPDPDAPEDFGEAAGFRTFTGGTTFNQVGDLLVSEPLFNQLGSGRLDGTRLRVSATLTTFSRSFSTEATVEVIGDSPSVCTDLELEGSGCSYRVVPGQGEVISVDDPEPGCSDAQSLSLRFIPDDPETRVCYESFSSGDIVETAVCTGDWALGDMVAMSMSVIDAGTCSPLIPRVDAPACVSACPGG